jgi:hypothetical protein
LYWTYNCDEYTKAKNIRIIITLILVRFLVGCSGGAAVKAKEEEQKFDSISTEMDQGLEEIETVVENSVDKADEGEEVE